MRNSDKWTRKLMMMYKALHRRDDIDKFYASRKEGKRGLTSIEDCVNATIKERTKKNKDLLQQPITVFIFRDWLPNQD